MSRSGETRRGSCTGKGLFGSSLPNPASSSGSTPTRRPRLDSTSGRTHTMSRSAVGRSGSPITTRGGCFASTSRFDGGRPQRIHVGTQPQDVAATAAGVWVADYGDQAVVRLDPATRRVLAKIKLHHHPVAVAAGGGLVAVATFGSPP